MSVSGIASYIEYGKQSNFTTAVSAGAGTRAFGMDQEITGFSIDEHQFEVGDFNTPLIQKYAFGCFEGAIGVNWTLSNPWWIDSVLSTAVTTGAGPYTHTYDDSKTVNSYTVEVGTDTTTDRVLQLQRLTAKDITISTAPNEIVKCSGNFQFGATPTTAGTSLDGSIVSDDIQYPYTCVQATLENPSGTPLAEVQNMECTLNPNIKMVPDLNSANWANAFKGRLDMTGKFSLSIVNNTWWNNVRARAEPTNNTLRMKFTNGLTSTNERTFQLTFTGLGLGKLNQSMPKYELQTEEIPWTARDLTAVAINNTSTPP